MVTLVCLCILGAIVFVLRAAGTQSGGDKPPEEVGVWVTFVRQRGCVTGAGVHYSCILGCTVTLYMFPVILKCEFLFANCFVIVELLSFIEKATTGATDFDIVVALRPPILAFMPLHVFLQVFSIR